MKKMSNKLLIVSALLIGIFLGIASLMFLNKFNSSKNAVKNSAILWSNEWHDRETNVPGSEFIFGFTGGKSIGFRIFTEDKERDVEVVITIDGKVYDLTNPNINDKRLVVMIPDEDIQKSHTVEGKVYCLSGLATCKVQISEIVLDGGKIVPWNEGKQEKTLGILGDSNSLYTLRNNYSVLLAESLKYHLHNASLWGRTVGKENGKFPAISLYQQDLIPFKPDIVVIFLGINDIYYKSSKDSFQRDYDALVTGIKKDLPQSKIVAVAILPGKKPDQLQYQIDDFNVMIKQLASKHNIYFADSTNWLEEEDFMDQLHLNEKGQRKIAEELRKIVVNSPEE